MYTANDLKDFSLGDAAFEPLLESLRNAKKFIFMQFFIVDEGKMLKSVLDILKEKVKEGRIVLAAYTDQIVKRFGEEKLGQIIDFMNEFYEVSKEVMNDMNTEDQKKKS